MKDFKEIDFAPGFFVNQEGVVVDDQGVVRTLP